MGRGTPVGGGRLTLVGRARLTRSYQQRANHQQQDEDA
ncbi:hypothetical protein C2W64_01396 [Brevibacillus laterosporus]|nr:hypothetical protein C2W64_01396 [Brevibacillus laterosporus]